MICMDPTYNPFFGKVKYYFNKGQKPYKSSAMKKKIVLPNGITMAQLAPSKDTSIERVVRMWLVRNGVRHKVQPTVSGKRPDFVAIAADGSRVAIEANGRFWHCPRSKMRTMSKFWRDKFRRNRGRDRRKRRILAKAGFRVVTVWDDEIKRGIRWERRLSRSLGLEDLL